MGANEETAEGGLFTNGYGRISDGVERQVAPTVGHEADTGEAKHQHRPSGRFGDRGDRRFKIVEVRCSIFECDRNIVGESVIIWLAPLPSPTLNAVTNALLL